jgi:hypothetical protein
VTWGKNLSSHLEQYDFPHSGITSRHAVRGY